MLNGRSGEERAEAACRLSGSLCQAKGGRDWVGSGTAGLRWRSTEADLFGVGDAVRLRPIADIQCPAIVIRMPVRMVKRWLTRWSNQQEAALWQMTNRDTVGKRLKGYGKSERVEAKFFLLAGAPLLPMIVSDELGWDRSVLWSAWMALTIVWAGSIFGVMFVSFWRAFRRSIRDWRNGS